MTVSNRWERVLVAGSLAVTTPYGVFAVAQSPAGNPKQLIETMISREQSARQTKVFYAYSSEERSERTGGHLWSERMVETAWGTVRYLITVDGKPLTTDQVEVEKSRLRIQTSDPVSYKKEDLKQDDSEHSRKMLAVLPLAFVFEIVSENMHEIRIAYHPDPTFTPKTMEERALYGMTGKVVLDTRTLRLHQLDGRAPKDVSLGFGPFATLRAGSNFATEREQVDGAVWRTANVKTAVQGRALLLKTIARQQEYRHSDFKRVPNPLSLDAAVVLAEREGMRALTAQLR